MSQFLAALTDLHLNYKEQLDKGLYILIFI